MRNQSDPEKTPKEVLEAIKKMMAQGPSAPAPQPDKVQEEAEEEQEKKRASKLRFDLKPKEVKKHLDRFVIKQEEAKRVLATAVCDHYNHVKRCAGEAQCGAYSKQNIVIIGPTGVGKTHLLRHIADLIGVPFAKADATKFSETGYAGGDVEDLIRDLVAKADGDIELAQYGMIYLDEIDKISTASELLGRDVSGSGVQRNLLKIMEDTEVSLRNPQDIQSQFQAMLEFQKKGKVDKPTINTRHILFIVSGSFDGLIPIIEKHRKDAAIGFTQSETKKLTPSNLLRLARTDDFIRFGFESEFIGRLPVRVVCDPLTEEDLYRILSSSEDSVMQQHVNAFGSYDIQMHLEEKALWEIAKQAVHEKTGARGLFTVCEKIFRDFKFDLPSSHIREFSLTSEMVREPLTALKEILKTERDERAREIMREIRTFEKAFFESTSFKIEFDDAGTDAIIGKVLDEGHEVTPFLNRLLANYHYGLKLIHQKTPQQKFVLNAEVVENPNGFLDRWIKDAYE